MQIISKETLQYFVVQGATIFLATIFSCYGIAASLGHVPVWLPMISDCAVYAPEKYLFRLGVVTGSIFIYTESFLLYNADKAFSNSRLSMMLSLLASMGLAVVGVVNEKENQIVHTGGAVVMFASYYLYMILMTFYSSREPTIGVISMAIKKLCTILGLTAMIALVVLYLSGASQTYVAVCEWIGTICIMIFNISFGADVDGIYLCEVKYSKNNNDCNEKKIVV